MRRTQNAGECSLTTHRGNDYNLVQCFGEPRSKGRAGDPMRDIPRPTFVVIVNPEMRFLNRVEIGLHSMEKKGLKRVTGTPGILLIGLLLQRCVQGVFIVANKTTCARVAETLTAN